MPDVDHYRLTFDQEIRRLIDKALNPCVYKYVRGD